MTSKAISVSSSQSKKSKKSKKIDLVEAGLFQGKSNSIRSRNDNFSEEDEEYSMTVEPVHQAYEEYDEDFPAYEEKENESHELDDGEIHPYAFYENNGDYIHCFDPYAFYENDGDYENDGNENTIRQSITDILRIEQDLSQGRIQHIFQERVEA